MPDHHSILAFVAASLIILVLPGPGVMYVVARSLGQGIGAGLVSAAGLSTGVLVHVAAATAGLSALLLASSIAFSVFKYAGAAYLVYLGWKAIHAAVPDHLDRRLPAVSCRRLFLDGVVVSALNPKIAAFFLAFLPQFVDPSAGPVAFQIAMLGILYAALAFCTDGAYGVFAGAARGFLRRRLRFQRLLNGLGGAVLIALGIKAAFSRAP